MRTESEPTAQGVKSATPFLKQIHPHIPIRKVPMGKLCYCYTQQQTQGHVLTVHLSVTTEFFPTTVFYGAFNGLISYLLTYL